MRHDASASRVKNEEEDERAAVVRWPVFPGRGTFGRQVHAATARFLRAKSRLRLWAGSKGSNFAFCHRLRIQIECSRVGPGGQNAKFDPWIRFLVAIIRHSGLPMAPYRVSPKPWRRRTTPIWPRSIRPRRSESVCRQTQVTTTAWSNRRLTAPSI